MRPLSRSDTVRLYGAHAVLLEREYVFSWNSLGGLLVSIAWGDRERRSFRSAMSFSTPYRLTPTWIRSHAHRERIRLAPASAEPIGHLSNSEELGGRLRIGGWSHLQQRSQDVADVAVVDLNREFQGNLDGDGTAPRR